jgi:hypothetical protein
MEFPHELCSALRPGKLRVLPTNALQSYATKGLAHFASDAESSNGAHPSMNFGLDAGSFWRRV